MEVSAKVVADFFKEKKKEDASFDDEWRIDYVERAVFQNDANPGFIWRSLPLRRDEEDLDVRFPTAHLSHTHC